MNGMTIDAPATGAAVTSRTANGRQTTLGDTIDAFMAGYAARDGTLAARQRWWTQHLESRTLALARRRRDRRGEACARRGTGDLLRR
jgi:dsRNA-specific ribonuclease